MCVRAAFCSYDVTAFSDKTFGRVRGKGKVSSLRKSEAESVLRFTLCSFQGHRDLASGSRAERFTSPFFPFSFGKVQSEM